MLKLSSKIETEAFVVVFSCEASCEVLSDCMACCSRNSAICICIPIRLDSKLKFEGDPCDLL